MKECVREREARFKTQDGFVPSNRNTNIERGHTSEASLVDLGQLQERHVDHTLITCAMRAILQLSLDEMSLGDKVV